MTILGQVTMDIFNKIYHEVKKPKNKDKLYELTGLLLDSLLQQIKPYFYTLIVMLFIMFTMNCVQFYYYVKMAATTPNVDIMKSFGNSF
jgi:hypothetical protein